jgi:hypothetical protein
MSLRYLTPQQVSAAEFISKKGMKSVNHLLDEYPDFTFAIIYATICR